MSMYMNNILQKKEIRNLYSILFFFQSLITETIQIELLKKYEILEVKGTGSADKKDNNRNYSMIRTQTRKDQQSNI